MTPENPQFLTQADLLPRIERLLPPDCSEEALLAEGKVFSPSGLLEILREAKRLLQTAPGPNLSRRCLLAESWYNSWFQTITRSIGKRAEEVSLFVESNKLMPRDEVSVYLLKNGVLKDKSGVLFVAGAEGHAGHLHAARWMAEHLGSWSCPIWVFERDSYFVNKLRGAPFLPLPARLSMWHYNSDVRVITLAPEREMGISEAEHYQKIFDSLGATYCFADEEDPDREEKINRGKEADFLIIPHLKVATTTIRTERLLPKVDGERREDEDIFSFFGGLSWLKPPSDQRFLEI